MARKALSTLPLRLAILLLLAGLPALALRLFSELSSGGSAPPATPSTLNRDLLILAGCTVVFAAIGWLVGHFMLRRRVLSLAAYARSIATSAPQPVSAKRYTGEFGALARDLEELRGAVDARTSHLEREQEHYKLLLDNLPEVAYIYSADPDSAHYKPYINARIEALTGYSAEEWLADPKLWKRILHPEVSERVMTAYEHSCKTGELFDCEYRIVTKEGKTRWVHDRALVSLESDGASMLMRGIMVDITARKQTQGKLQAGLGKVEGALAAAGDALVGLDHHQTVTLFNSAAERLFRMERSAVIGQNVSTLFDDDPYIAPQIRLDLHGKRSDGTIFIADTVISYTESGNSGLYLLTMRDVTDLRSESDRLRYAEASFRRMFVSNPHPMWLYDTESLSFLQVNDAAVGRYGYTREEFLSMRVTDLRVQEDVLRLVESASGSGNEQKYAVQSRHQCKDGRIIDVQLLSSAWEHDGRGAVLVVAEDVTERKLAEEALRESEKRFRAFFEGTALGVALVDVEGRIVKSNPALHSMLGYSREELRAVALDSLSFADDRPVGHDPLNDLASSMIDHVQTERRYVRKDGIVIWTNLTASLVRGSRQQPQFSIYMIEDITERKNSQEQIKRQLDRFAALRNVDMVISASLDLRVTLNVILDEVVKQLRVDAADVMLLNPHTHVLEYAAGCGFRQDGIMRSHVRLGEGYAGRTAMHRRTHTVKNITESGDLLRAPLLSGEGFISYTAVPLVAKGQVKGVLEVFHRVGSEPDPEWLGFLEALAGQAAIAIDNAAMFYDIQRSNSELTLAYDVTLEGWSRALDLRDRETEGHTQRVTEMTIRLARAMGTSDSEMIHIHRGALLHDIGKMGIPDSILLKAGPLTQEEWEIMRLHPTYAYELLSPISFLKPAIDIPYCHHEKWDGTGYPRKLKGEQIPLSARIFAIVDVWDALRSNRPYRKAWPEGKVREHIRSLSGTHFDPRVVEVFLNMEPPPPVYQSAVPLDDLMELIERRKAEGGMPEVPWAAERTRTPV